VELRGLCGTERDLRGTGEVCVELRCFVWNSRGFVWNSRGFAWNSEDLCETQTRFHFSYIKLLKTSLY
jgi:hypothetical protein